MPKTIENSFSDYYDLAYGELKTRRNGLLSNSDLNELMSVPNPCLVVIKPHAAENSRLVSIVKTLMDDVGLHVLTEKKTRFTREHVFGIYGDLCEVMAQGSEGVAFVEGLVSSFVDCHQEGRVIIVYGQDSYDKMKKIKKIIRELGKEDRFRNVLHSSDDIACAMKEITALLPKQHE
jgi:nucleoside diphosphate kinase